ncbi:MAG: Trk system potassium transporter TrkA [SAR86 cluster bacterium]|uniref:Trk system potassium uptake protein TrkA n=1 Tax=SAR86 cluster bacterium TaxID=2030880 RepID=A0A368C5Z1_9GAMM|nr:MAG: Trk system potassium transporter TrkA [SAR86 cluster bacterium]|tara:strand:+ start:25 stop:1380 length:1356 start_codon:yes stop_codon:yes gene_type:complete
MKVIILGAGKVGESLARNLSQDGYDISIVDLNKNKVDELQDRLDIAAIIGHAAHPSTFKKAGADEETILLAVTNNDEVNIAACQIAKNKFSVKKTICRFKDSTYLDCLDSFGESIIDIPISPENEVTSHLKELIDHPGAEQIEEFADGKVKLVSVKVKKTGRLVDKALRTIEDDMPGVDSYIPTIYRKGKPFIPNGDTIVKEGDEVYFVTASENVDAVVNEMRLEQEAYSRIMIIGGGKIGFNLAKQLEDSYKVKIIEPNEERCEEISRSLEKTIVLRGKGADQELLKSENISQVDVFCSLTNDDEANIMASLLAKKLGATKTMVILNNPSYVNILPGFVDSCIAPHRLTVSSVLQHLRESDVAQDVILKMHSGAEAIEGIVHANEYTSDYFGKPIKSLPMPEEASIGAIVRKGVVVMPSSSIELCIEDHLIIFLSNKEKVKEVEKLFTKS